MLVAKKQYSDFTIKAKTKGAFTQDPDQIP